MAKASVKTRKPECKACFDEEGSYACLRVAHKNERFAKKARNEAAHEAFEAHIKERYTLLDVFTDWPLDRNENGSYINMSVSMDWTEWYNGWCSALKFMGVIK